jgi:hypothetical protein
VNLRGRIERLEQQRRPGPERVVILVWPNIAEPEPAYPGERLKIIKIMPWPGEEDEGDGTACDGVAKHHDAA